MSENFEGFTQEEILNITNQKHIICKSPSQINTPVKKIAFKQNKYGKKNMTRERMLKTFSKNNQETGENLTQEAKLFIPQIPEEDEFEDSTVSNIETEQNTKLSQSLLPEQSDDSRITNTSNNISFSPPLFLSQTDGSLNDFEQRQKIIKEQNRQRKELLKKALEDRTKKTHEEARRLSQIEEELKKLDIQLSSDVSILRNEIEVASLEFMEAQKRFDRAEREYLDAKLALFTKRERKELLTGHLCTIIEQNELRKAKKLSDLMDKLQLGSVVIEKTMAVAVASSETAEQNANNDKTSTEQNVNNKTPTEQSANNKRPTDVQVSS